MAFKKLLPKNIENQFIFNIITDDENVGKLIMLHVDSNDKQEKTVLTQNHMEEEIVKTLLMNISKGGYYGTRN